MAWLAVNENGIEVICKNRPKRIKVYHIDIDTLEYRWEDSEIVADSIQWHNIYLPDGAIRKLIGRKLTWDDEPVEI